MSVREHDVEPIPGLPDDLPEGEQILWQGRPCWRALARHAFKIRGIAIYLGAFVAARAAFAIHGGEGVSGLAGVGFALLLSAICLAIVAAVAWLQARAAVYTITNRRVVMRIGASVPLSWNLPFKRLASADLSARGDGEGDIVLALAPPDRISWLFLWPHVQPGHVVQARPALRALRDAPSVAAILEKAVTAWARQKAAPVIVAREASRDTEREPIVTDDGIDVPLGVRLAPGRTLQEAGR